jgi:hypothetical protein
VRYSGGLAGRPLPSIHECLIDQAAASIALIRLQGFGEHRIDLDLVIGEFGADGGKSTEIALGIRVADLLIDDPADGDQSSCPVTMSCLVGNDTHLKEGGRLTRSVAD